MFIGAGLHADLDVPLCLQAAVDQAVNAAVEAVKLHAKIELQVTATWTY